MNHHHVRFVDLDGPEPVQVGDELVHPFGCAAMFNLAFGRNDGLRTLDGRQCEDATAFLETAVAHLENPTHAKRYARMRPPNGPGDVGSATKFLRDVLDRCRKHPYVTMEVEP